MARPLRVLGPLAALVLAVACAGPAGGSRVGDPSLPPAASVRGGGLTLRLGEGTPVTARFDDGRVVAPGRELTLAGGRWRGRLGGRQVELAAAADHVRGDGVELDLFHGDRWVAARGFVAGRRVELGLSPERATVTTERCALALDATAVGRYEGEAVCLDAAGEPRREPAVLTLAGDALALDRPALPQVMLALLVLVPDRE